MRRLNSEVIKVLRDLGEDLVRLDVNDLEQTPLDDQPDWSEIKDKLKNAYDKIAKEGF